MTASLVALLLLPALAAEETPLPQGWDYAAAMKAVAAKNKGRPGVVLHVGDSITYANPYGQWARAGQGRSEEDKAALAWMHAGKDDDSDGWYLARADQPGGRSFTAAGGMRADEMLAGGKGGLPSLAALLDRYRPQAVVLMIGTNDVGAGRAVEAYAADVEKAVGLMQERGVVPVLSTIPPHVGRPDLARAYNEALRKLAKGKSLPLIDYEAEVLKRRPDDWNGTLLGKNDVHPTAAQGGATASSAPTAENLRNSGYLLRGWLSVKKLAEVKRLVFDADRP
jgi:lysophospholipase L1-like esterase